MSIRELISDQSDSDKAYEPHMWSRKLSEVIQEELDHFVHEGKISAYDLFSMLRGMCARYERWSHEGYSPDGSNNGVSK